MNNKEPVVITLYLQRKDPQSVQVLNWVTEINSEGSYKIVEIYPEDDPKGGRFEETMPYLIAGPYQIRPPIEKVNVEIAMRAALERQKQLLESHNEEFHTTKRTGKEFFSIGQNDPVDYQALYVLDQYVPVLIHFSPIFSSHIHENGLGFCCQSCLHYI